MMIKMYDEFLNSLELIINHVLWNYKDIPSFNEVKKAYKNQELIILNEENMRKINEIMSNYDFCNDEEILKELDQNTPVIRMLDEFIF